MDTTDVTIALGTIVVFGVGAQWLSRVAGVPSIVLLLFAGIIAGPVTGLVDPEELLGDTLDPAVSLLVGLLLFDSGMSLRWAQRPSDVDVVYRLVTFGLIVTWVVGAAASYLIFDLSLEAALLLGVLLVVSGPTVVGPIVKAARPRPPTGAVLKWEGTILDPLSAALGAAVLTVITTDTGPVLGTVGILLATAALGIAIGLACAALFVVAWRNYAIPDDLQVPVAFMLAVLAFSSAAAVIPEAGLFAALTLGLALANQPYAAVAQVRRFEASIGTVVVAVLFITLAATIDLSELRSVLGKSALLLAALVIVARPLATIASTLRSGLPNRDRGFVASVAPRGIVAASTVSFYALTLEQNGIDAGGIEPITFAVIIGAGIVYGFGSPVMARVVGVSRGTPKGIAIFASHDVAARPASALGSAGVPVLVVDPDAADDTEHDPSYELFTGSLVSDDLIDAMDQNDVGMGLVGTEERGLDFVAVKRCVHELGKPNAFYIPRQAPGSEAGIEARWRARTPDRFVAFGPEVTRASLREVLGTEGKLAWLDIEAEGSGLPDGAIPLFIVTGQGRGIVASLQSLDQARHGRLGEDARVLYADRREGHGGQ